MDIPSGVNMIFFILDLSVVDWSPLLVFPFADTSSGLAFILVFPPGSVMPSITVCWSYLNFSSILWFRVRLRYSAVARIGQRARQNRFSVRETHGSYLVPVGWLVFPIYARISIIMNSFSDIRAPSFGSQPRFLSISSASDRCCLAHPGVSNFVTENLRHSLCRHTRTVSEALLPVRTIRRKARRSLLSVSPFSLFISRIASIILCRSGIVSFFATLGWALR